MSTADPNPFTPVSRAFLERADLSPETRLVAVYLDTFTANWTVREAHITRALGIGRRAYQRAIRELKAAGLMKDGGRTPQGVKPPVFDGRAQVRDPRAQSLSHVTRPITKKRTTNTVVSSGVRSLGRELHLALTPELPSGSGAGGSRADVSAGAGATGSSSPRALQPSSSRAVCSFGCELPFGTNVRMHMMAFHPKAAA